MRLIKLLLFLLFAGIVLFSCSEDEECRRERFVNLKVGFYKDSINLQGDRVISKRPIDSLSVWGVGHHPDSVYRNVEAINLPLDKFNSKSQFVFQVKKNDPDTLTVYYTTEEMYLSYECGILHTFVLDSISFSYHYFNFVDTISSEVNTSNVENIRIFHNS